MTLSRILPAVGATLLLATACASETYDHIPIDILYRSTATSGTDFTLSDGEPLELQQFGIAIGFTRIELCDKPETASRWNPLKLLQSTDAHAHSPSTPTSSGIPVILSTDIPADSNEDLVRSALRPVPGNDICHVKVQLLNSDDDAHMLQFFPQIEGHASAAVFNEQFIGSFAGRPVTFDLDPPLRIAGDIQFTISLEDEDWQREIAKLEAKKFNTAQDLADALQDAAMAALRFDVTQHVPAGD